VRITGKNLFLAMPPSPQPYKRKPRRVVFSASRTPSERKSNLARKNPEDIVRYADMFTAMGTEPRLRIMRLLLSAHPEGMVVSDVGRELGIAASTMSHHLEKLKHEDLVKVRREGTYLWYSANTDALQALLGFLYAECCTRNKAIAPEKIVCCP
jgi:ArsR family transcriptional regulator